MKWSEILNQENIVDSRLYEKYEVKRGLRDHDGKGVLAGLTRIGEIHSYVMNDGDFVPEAGQLIYRGMDINQMVKGFMDEKRFGFEEIAYLLLIGVQPNQEQLKLFKDLLASYRKLPYEFIKDMIMGLPCNDLMNVMSRSVLGLYSYDHQADETSVQNVLRQSLQLIAVLPLLAVYAFQSYQYYHGKKSLIIHTPDKSLSTAENILQMLRPDKSYTELEAKVLDLALVLHAEHGGGNNSTFTTHVVTSTGTDTYSAISAAIGSLKGPRHGGANIKVIEMIDDLKKSVSNWREPDQVEAYLKDILNKKAFDRKGLVYGMGHAVYTLSDPRARIFKRFVHDLAEEKDWLEELHLYDQIERLTPELMKKYKCIDKPICANIDLYSGFVYRMLGIPEELFTPLFAVARVVGWSAHRLEEIVNQGKIIRPAYRSVAERRVYVSLNDRR